MRIDFILVVLVVVSVFWQYNSTNKSVSQKEVKIQQAFPIDVGFEESTARVYLNDIREAMGMNALVHNSFLENASASHAEYLVAHHSASHYEVQGKRYFTGEKPVDRTIHAEYISRIVSENLSTQTKNAKASIDGLFSAIYHRFGFLDTKIDELGIGVTQNPDNPEETAFVYLMGNSNMRALCYENTFDGVGKYYTKICKDVAHRVSKKNFDKAKSYQQKNNPKIILYPYANQVQVPPAFYVETPDPLPDYDVSGFPVSITFNDYYFDKVELLSFTLYDSDDTLIENVRLMDKENDPHGHLSDKQFALFPLERLDYDSLYRVEAIYVYKGQEEKIAWEFMTEIPTEKLFVIEEKISSIQVAVGESYILYFKPLDAHDILKTIHFPTDISLERLDNNTFKLTANKDLGDFEIKSGERVLSVEML